MATEFVPDAALMPEEFDQRLIEHLAEQMSFLDTSCEAYDAGQRAECKRLAVTVRVLVHDVGRSISLLHRLGVKRQIRWCDAPDRLMLFIAENDLVKMSTYNGSFSLLSTPGVNPKLEHEVAVGEWEVLLPIIPNLVKDPDILPMWTSFEQWWTLVRLVTSTGTEVSRRMIVDMLANKEGGAHVDGRHEAFEELIGDVGFGFFPSGTIEEMSPTPAAMRQIAEEVRLTIRGELGFLLERANYPDKYSY